MPQNDYNQLIEKFQQFRKKLYNCFVCGHDSVLDLLDALSSNQSARSIAELCLNPLFRRHYSALYKAIGQCLSSTRCEETSLLRQQQQQSLLEAVAQLIGQRRQELTAMCSYQAYRQRFDMEHMLRFGKQRLLMGAFQTPEVEHEENWIQLTLLAYAQLWAARKLAVHLPRPWERYLTRNLNPTITPSMVQRSFLRIITQIGTPAISPKPRGFSTGRVPGQSLGKRQRQSVLKKGKKSQSSPQKTA